MFSIFGGSQEQKVKNQVSDKEMSELTHAKAFYDSVGQSQAIIEFNPDGTILFANDNFLAAMGYRLSEIQGKHHRMFCESNYAKSAEYQQFWRDLANGKFHQGQCNRVKANGDPVWLEASYNPIADKYGKVQSVIKIARDITAVYEKNNEAEEILKALHHSSAVIEFDTTGKILTANENFISATGYSLNQIVGKHHRMFCTSDHSASSEYQHFWNRLARGEAFSGLYERVNSKGRAGSNFWLLIASH